MRLSLVERSWPRRRCGADVTGLWDDTVLPPPPRHHVPAPATTLLLAMEKPTLPSAALLPCFVTVDFNVPFSIDGVHGTAVNTRTRRERERNAHSHTDAERERETCAHPLTHSLTRTYMHACMQRRPLAPLDRAWVVPLIRGGIPHPHPTSSFSPFQFSGVGLIVDTARGLVVVDGNTVPVAIGDLSLTFASSIIVPGRIGMSGPR
jgi:hypothetical protein